MSDPVALVAEARGEPAPEVVDLATASPDTLAAIARGATNYVVTESPDTAQRLADAAEVIESTTRPTSERIPDTPLPPDDRRLLTDQRSQPADEAFMARAHRPPGIPAGVALPEACRPAIEAYELAGRRLDEAEHKAEMVRHERHAAERKAQLARVAAAQQGIDSPPPPAEDWPGKLAHAEGTVAAHRLVLDRAGTAVTASLRANGGLLYRTALAQWEHNRREAAEALNRLEAALAATDASLSTLGHVGREFLAGRIPRDVVIEPQPDTGRWNRTVGRGLRDLMEHDGADIIGGPHRFRPRDLKAYLASDPVAYDPLAQAYLAPFLNDEPDEPDAAAKRAKGKR